MTQRGWLYRLRHDGRLDMLLNNIPSPNGLVLSLDEATVFVNVTRANAVWRVPLLADGVPTRWASSSAYPVAVDQTGLAMDAKGNLAVAHLGLGTVWLFSALGEPLADPLLRGACHHQRGLWRAGRTAALHH